MIPNLREAELAQHWPSIQALQSLAEHYGIKDIFQDAGGKMLQIAIRVGVDLSPERNGPDATDRLGNEYEIKTTDISRTKSGFSTNHHLNETTIARFRRRRWIFAFYDGIRLDECFLLEGHQLAPIFREWTRALHVKPHLNNPKIPISFVRKHGTRIGSPASQAAA